MIEGQQNFKHNDDDEDDEEVEEDGQVIRLNEKHYKMPKCVQKIYKIRVITTPNIDGGYIPSYKVYCKYALFYNS